MASQAHPVVRVRLARSLPRLLAAPVALVVSGAALAVAGLLLLDPPAGFAAVGAGALLAIAGIGLGAIPLSVRVQVDESLVRVTSILGRRVYLLTPGSLTRVHLRGEGASRIHARFGVGWALGAAVLRGEEEIHVVRLAPADTVILIPTARGRLAIASSNESHLIDALTRAAQARAVRAELAIPEPAVAAPAPLPAEAAPDPAFLTGIERAQYEARMAAAAEAAAAAAAATAPQATGAVPPAAIGKAPAAAGVEVAASVAPAAEPRGFRTPSWARRRPSAPSMPSVQLPSVAMPRVPQRVRDLPVGRPTPGWLVPLIPLVGAGLAWGIGLTIGEMPADGSADSRLTALGLVLAGPGSAIGAVMARTWWPRISGVVVTGGLIASVFIGRALLGA